MGSYFVLAFVACIALAIGQGLIKRRSNPYAQVSYAELPPRLREEIERLLPDFSPDSARLTQLGDEARLEGEWAGVRVSVEADFDAQGELVELEFDTHRSTRKTGRAALEDLPEAARLEIDRVIGDDRAGFEASIVFAGSDREGGKTFELKGASTDWKWEIEVSATGQLLELEKEKRLRRR